jgi:hypothetical protein
MSEDNSSNSSSSLSSSSSYLLELVIPLSSQEILLYKNLRFFLGFLQKERMNPLLIHIQDFNNKK